MSDASAPSPSPTQPPAGAAPGAASLPRTFGEYLRSFGPGIVVVLTWLGAGDIIDMGVAGANYGYSLMWVLVAALLFRYFFVCLLARYHLCNQHGETVLDGLVRLHRWYAPGLVVAAVVMGHIYGSYMSVGVGEICRNVAGFGQVWQWALVCNATAFLLVFQPEYKRLELAFLFFLAVLSVSFLGSALWVGFNPSGVALGLIHFEMPGHSGHYHPMLVAGAMIGAVGGSLMNLIYPYFLEAKGWRGPQYLRVQRFDLLFGIGANVVLNLAVWTLGAELLFPDKPIKNLDDLPQLLTTVIGNGGRLLFYAGIFAAVYTSIVGHAAGLGHLGSHAWLRARGAGPSAGADLRRHSVYRGIAVWCLISPLVWTLPGMPDFVTLTLIGNSGQVLLLPLLAGGIWWITASPRFIGERHRTRWWENVVMALLFVLAVNGAYHSAQAIVQFIAAR